MASDRCDLLCLDLPRAEHVRERLDYALIAQAAAQARALGDATRLTVATALREGGELCVCDLAWITGRAENLVGHHLRTLRDAGLAGSRRDGKIVFYSLTEPGQAVLDTQLQQALTTTSGTVEQ
ncbi:MAG: ArsR/SmtB family transcription factor [Solirubrobacteraceae bacterium]